MLGLAKEGGMICEEKCFTVSIAYDRRDYCFLYSLR